MSRPLLDSWTTGSRERLKYLFTFLALLLIGTIWYMNDIQPDNLQKEISNIAPIDFFETPWLYAGLLVFTGSFPLIFGFIPRLKFYKQWGYVLLANLPVTVFFIAWDIYFTQKGVWGFSSAYTTGPHLFNLPWEECLFFVIIPSACTFIYWSLNSVLSREPFQRSQHTISILLIVVLCSIGLWKWEHIYTSTATLLCGLFLLFHVLFIPARYRGRFYLAYVISCIPFLIVNGILTGGFTKGPVVMYNPEEYFGLRVGTVPVDDFAYSFLMLFSNITLFEAFRKGKE